MQIKKYKYKLTEKQINGIFKKGTIKKAVTNSRRRCKITSGMQKIF